MCYKCNRLECCLFINFFHHCVKAMSVLSLRIAILCLKVEQKQVCEQLFELKYIGKLFQITQ